MEDESEPCGNGGESHRPGSAQPDREAMFRYQEHIDQRLDSLDDFLRIIQADSAKGEVQ